MKVKIEQFLIQLWCLFQSKTSTFISSGYWNPTKIILTFQKWDWFHMRIKILLFKNLMVSLGMFNILPIQRNTHGKLICWICHKLQSSQIPLSRIQCLLRDKGEITKHMHKCFVLDTVLLRKQEASVQNVHVNIFAKRKHYKTGRCDACPWQGSTAWITPDGPWHIQPSGLGSVCARGVQGCMFAHTKSQCNSVTHIAVTHWIE